MAQPQIKEVPERWIASDAGRQVIYIVVAAALGIASAVGFLTAEQAADILASIVNLAGVLGFSLAAANKPKPAPAELAG